MMKTRLYCSNDDHVNKCIDQYNFKWWKTNKAIFLFSKYSCRACL